MESALFLLREPLYQQLLKQLNQAYEALGKMLGPLR